MNRELFQDVYSFIILGYNANTHSRRKRVYWNSTPVSTAGAYSTEEIWRVRIDSRTYKKNAGVVRNNIHSVTTLSYILIFYELKSCVEM